jgi:hypothetical protein
VTNARDFAQLTETLKHMMEEKAQNIGRYEKWKIQYSQNKVIKKETKSFTETWSFSIYRTENLPLWQKRRLTGTRYGEKKHSSMKEQNG